MNLDVGVAPCMKSMRVAVNTWAWYVQYPMKRSFRGLTALLWNRNIRSRGSASSKTGGPMGVIAMPATIQKRCANPGIPKIWFSETSASNCTSQWVGNTGEDGSIWRYSDELLLASPRAENGAADARTQGTQYHYNIYQQRNHHTLPNFLTSFKSLCSAVFRFQRSVSFNQVSSAVESHFTGPATFTGA